MKKKTMFLLALLVSVLICSSTFAATSVQYRNWVNQKLKPSVGVIETGLQDGDFIMSGGMKGVLAVYSNDLDGDGEIECMVPYIKQSGFYDYLYICILDSEGSSVKKKADICVKQLNLTNHMSAELNIYSRKYKNNRLIVIETLWASQGRGNDLIILHVNKKGRLYLNKRIKSESAVMIPAIPAYVDRYMYSKALGKETMIEESNLTKTRVFSKNDIEYSDSSLGNAINKQISTYGLKTAYSLTYGDQNMAGWKLNTSGNTLICSVKAAYGNASSGRTMEIVDNTHYCD